MTLNELRDRAHQIAIEHGFTGASVPEDIALMHSELSEALEDFRNGERPNDMWYETPVGTRSYAQVDGGGRLLKPCGIPSEMADELIRILHFCGKHNIDIEHAVHEKMKYNDSRPFKHGNKVL